MMLSPVLRAPLTQGALLLACVGSTACDSKKSPAHDQSATNGQSATNDESSRSKQGTTDQEAPSQERPSAKEARKLIEALPKDEEVQKIVNPKNLPPHEGPTGAVRGVVVASGDAGPRDQQALSKMKDNCTDAPETFGTVFREGPGRTLADVLVAVTEYDGFVPEKESHVVIQGKGCAWNTRTVAMTFGQGLSVHGLDNRPYVPELLGQRNPAQLFVLPGAPPAKLPPQKPGRYTLVDSMRLYNRAEVFVLPYSTHDVTGLDGKFEISGIPVGEVKLSALLPATGGTSNQLVTIEEGKTLEVKITLPFDLEEYEKREKPPALEDLPAQ